MALIPKTHQNMVAALFRTIFAPIDAASVQAQWDQVTNTLASRWPKAAELMRTTRHEVLAFSAFPHAHWREIWSTNPLERMRLNHTGNHLTIPHHSTGRYPTWVWFSCRWGNG